MTNKKFTFDEKEAFERQCDSRSQALYDVLNGTNKLEKAKTKENAASKMMDNNYINYNPEILLKLVQVLLNSPLVREKLREIINAKTHLKEIPTRNLLYGIWTDSYL